MNRFLRPVEVILKDDTYQGNKKFIDFELWHFEAVFDNGYSFLLGLMIYHLGKSGIVKTRFGVYNNRKTKVETNKTYLLSNAATSKETPFFEINGKLSIIFDQNHYEKTKEWCYNISISDNDNRVGLKFLGTTSGWKTKTDYTNWAAILPKATVTGSITQKGRKIPLRGIGYHDHNWGQSPIMFLKKIGWFCGTIFADTLKITWAKALRTSEKGELLVVINQDINKSLNKKGFFIIPPKNIIFTIKNYIYKHKRWIPSEINLKIRDMTTEDGLPVSAELHMKIYDIKYINFFTIQYCVCLVRTTGMLSLGSTTEYLNNSTQIIEFPSFISKDRKTQLLDS
jgi:hypothetical protein